MKKELLTYFMALNDHDILARIYLDFNCLHWPKDLPEGYKPSFWDNKGFEEYLVIRERKHGFALPFINYIKSVVRPEKISYWRDLRSRLRKNNYPYEFILKWPRNHELERMAESCRKALSAGKIILFGDTDEIQMVESVRPLNEIIKPDPIPIKNFVIPEIKIETPSLKVIKEEHKKQVRKGWDTRRK